MMGVTPPKTKVYETRVRTAAMVALAQWRQAHKAQWHATGEFELECAVYFGDKYRRDIDNCFKSCGDALNGLLYDDDSQVAKLGVERFLGADKPRMEVFIRRRG